MTQRTPVVAVVVVDPRVVEPLENLFESAGHVVRTLSSTQALIEGQRPISAALPVGRNAATVCVCRETGVLHGACT